VLKVVEIRWRDPKESPHFFLLRASPAGSPGGSVAVDLADVSAVDVARWADPSLGLTCLMSSGDDLAVRFNVDDSVTALRLTFTVTPQVNGKSCEALTVVQRFTFAGGRLVPDRYEIPRYVLNIRSYESDDPVAQKVPSRVAGTARAPRKLFGAHPLVSVTGATARVDTEFLDVTNLWWDLHFQRVRKNPPPPVPFSPLYLAPGCAARSSQLLVLVNTRSTPMIWFAAVPEVATSALPDGTTIGGYVFLRPPGGHPIDYSSAQPGGLADSVLGTTGMDTLARYLLTGRTHAQKDSVSMLPDWNLLLGYAEKNDYVLNANGALACGMEESLHRAAKEQLAQTHSVRILLMPQRSISAGYGTIVGAGLPARVDAAIGLIWSRDIIGGSGQQLVTGATGSPQRPQEGLAAASTGTLRLDPDYWIGGYSRSGDTLWAALQVPGNRAGVGRIVAFDPTGFSQAPDVIGAVAQARGKRGLRVFVLWSPYTLGSPPTAAVDAMRRAGATVTLLPETGPDYFRMPPNPKAPWVEYIFQDNRPWTGGLQPVDKAGGWWHQIIAFAGEHLVTDPQNPASVSFMLATMRP